MSNWLTKIIFKNNSRPAINDTNLNLLQTYIENAIERAYSAAIAIVDAGGSEEEMSQLIDSLLNAILDYNSNANSKVEEFNETVDEKIKEVIETIEKERQSLIEDVLNSEGLNSKFKNYEEKHINYRVVITEEIEELTEYELPFSYTVGNNSLVVFLNNERLICEKTEDDQANYKEVGETGATSNKLIFGFTLDVGDILDFIVKGVVEDE